MVIEECILFQFSLCLSLRPSGREACLSNITCYSEILITSFVQSTGYFVRRSVHLSQPEYDHDLYEHWPLVHLLAEINYSESTKLTTENSTIIVLYESTVMIC